MNGAVLIVEDEPGLMTALSITLRRAGFEVSEAETLAKARAALEREIFDVVLTDLRLPDGDGLALVKAAQEAGADALVMTAFGTIETAVEAIRLGAIDFIQKPFANERLLLTLNRALQHRSLVDRVRRLGDAKPAPEIAGVSAAIEVVRERIRQAAASRAVLILGETGTGKELAARAVHAVHDPAAPFVVVSAASLGESVLENELFGHAPGAFPGAMHARRGLLAEAQGGTVFFDEIADVPLAAQARLLRFVQFGEVKPLGSNHTLTVRARVAAATSRDPARELREGRLREDLYFRLDVFRIEMPPLRKRPEDVRPLAEHLLRRIARDLRRPLPVLRPSAMERLVAHDWPGNVRELENALERAVLVAPGPELEVEHLPDLGVSQALRARAGSIEALADVEKRHILSVLEQLGGDRSKAILALGISKSTLRRKLIEYGAWTATGAETEEGEEG